jgi:YD repeat-containing protein
MTRGVAFALVFPLSIGLFSIPAFGQNAINQPVSDEHGVERKSGRALFPLPEIVSIGGEGAGRISIAYQHVDGTALSLPSVPTIAREEIIPPENVYYPNPLAERYIATTISFGSTSERFRQIWTGGGYSSTFTSEYPTGSTFDGTTYVDKHGLKIIFGYAQAGYITTVQYPVGRVETYDLLTLDPAMSIKNNFGYALKVRRDQTQTASGMGSGYHPFKVTYQAVNLASDFCALSDVGLCQSLSKDRKGSLEALTAIQSIPTSATGYQYWEKFVFTNPVGEGTVMRNELLGAMIQAPHCIDLSIPFESGPFTYSSCSAPVIGWRPYPAGLTPPGSTTETHVIDYNLQPNQVSYESHEKIRITQVVKDGVVVDYEPVYYKPQGSYGGVAASPSWLWLKSKINGQEISYSESYGLHPFWGQSRRVLKYVRDANGRTTNFPYDAEWEINGVTYPEGNGIMHERDARQNITKIISKAKPGSGLPDLITGYTYAASCTIATQATCNKPLTMTDPKGNVTEYTYNTMGQVLTETKPSPTAGAPRPKVTNSYTMRTAYIKDASGNPVAAGPPISLLTQTSRCITLTSCSGTSDEVLTTFDYGPTTGLNNLNLRGFAVTAANSAGQIETLRTCYQYNYFGEKIAETKPLGTGSMCS